MCGKEGHKANTYPDRRDKATKRVQMREQSPELLDENDVLATVDGYSLPMTIDTGAKISIMPTEFVRENLLIGRVESIKGFEKMALFGEVPTALVDIRVGDLVIPRKVALLDGETLAQVAKYRHSLTEDKSKYISPKKVGETMMRAVVWKTGEPDKVMSDTEVTIKPTSDDLKHQKVLQNGIAKTHT